MNRRFVVISLLYTALFFGLLTAARGQSGAAPAKLDTATQQSAVAELAKLLRERYVFAEVGAKAAAFLEAQLQAGKYAGLSAFAFADALTKDAQSVTRDLHLRIGVAPPQMQPAGSAGPTEQERAARRARQDAELRRMNYGFHKVERLPGNVGYLDLRGFISAELGGATAVAAMNFLAGSDAVIIDLRQNGGGSPDMIALISSYFFEEPTHLNSLHWRTPKGERVDQFWTLPHVPGRRMPNTPLYVLTSKRTFSAAEEFANNMRALKRATLVGEVTGGGANPGEGMPLPGGFGVFMPTGRAVNPIDNSNWEGKGVEPHVKVAAADALRVAHQAALEKIVATAADEAAKAQAQWALDGLRAQAKPATLSAAEMQAIAGQYGDRSITLENGALYYERAGRGKKKLLPLSGDLFALEEIDYFRLRVVREGGKVTGVEGQYDDGRRDFSGRG